MAWLGDGVNREKIVNLPGVVSALIALLVAIEIAGDMFPNSIGRTLMVYGSFIPARITYLFAPNRFFQALEGVDIDGDELASFLNTTGDAWWTPLSYAFLHANWTHLGVNCLTLAAFGAPVARRLGTARFIAFFAITAVAGAAAHLVAHPFDLAPVVGASAAISGAMGGIVRFAFAHGEALGERSPYESAQTREARKPLSLKRALANRRAAFFVFTWIAVNLFFGVAAQPPGGAGVIAWEAHMGGFLAGLLLFGLFDATGRRPGGPAEAR
jgi:membrane associated rhomboid family serine protease